MSTKEHESIGLIKEYRKYLRKLLGKKMEEASWVIYDAGWYKYKWAQKFEDGSYGRIGPDVWNCRKIQFVEQIKELKERTKEKK